MKIINSGGISPFGGLNFVVEAFDNLGAGALLDRYLPVLPAQSRYTWRDIIYSLWSIPFCGGDSIEDLDLHLRPTLSDMPMVEPPSPDRVLSRLKSLALPGMMCRPVRGPGAHLLSFNLPLNNLNLAILKKINAQDLKKGVLDFDNTILFTDKEDATMTYKHDPGYFPAVGMMGNSIVYVENRNGHTGPHTLQHLTLDRMFTMLEQQSIPVKAFRADSASYQFDTLAVINRHVDKVYIRPRMNAALARAIGQIKDWEPVTLCGQDVYRGETRFTPFVRTAKRNKQTDLLTTYRLIVTKELRRDGQRDLFTGEACNYSCIITTDWDMDRDKAVLFYNQRGTSEKEFDILKNDFNWRRLPFSRLQQNTAYLILMAMCRNLYNQIIHRFSKVFRHLKPHYRLKKFIFRFITVPAKWTKRARSHHLKIYRTIQLRE